MKLQHIMWSDIYDPEHPTIVVEYLKQKGLIDNLVETL